MLRTSIPNCKMTSLFEIKDSSSVDRSMDKVGVEDRCLRNFCLAAVDFPLADLAATGTFSNALVKAYTLKQSKV